MRTDVVRRVPMLTGLLAGALVSALALVASAGAEEAASGVKEGADWESWHANNNVADLASVQRGARNFASYCLGCHSAKYRSSTVRIPSRLCVSAWSCSSDAVGP